MAQLSKLIDDTCREFCHPWINSCSCALTGLGIHAVQASFRVYCTVYLASLLSRGKVPTKGDVKKTVLGILQSTAFLSWNGSAFCLFICLLRRMFGHFHLLTVSFLPCFLASITAIFIERPSRRTLLTLYVSNVASETLFRMGVSRGYWYPVPYAETYIFAISTAALLYYYRSKINKPDPIYKMLRIIVGEYEDAKYLENRRCEARDSIEAASSSSNSSSSSSSSGPVLNSSVREDQNVFTKSLETYKNLIRRLKAKETCCPHPFGCVHYTLKGGAQMFGYALGGQLTINLVFGLNKLIKNPLLLKSMIAKKGNLKLPIFVGGFAALYRLVSCSLRRSFQKDSPYFALPAALIGGLTFTAYKSNMISLYFMWKGLHILWNDLVEKEIVPEVKWFGILLYSFSTAVLFHAAIVEPQNLRSSYWKFLHNISGGRIAAMSRVPIDKFGLDTSKHLENVLKATNTTNKLTFRF